MPPSRSDPLRSRAATSRALGHLQKSAGIMQQMNALIKLPELGKSLQELAKEMMKARCATLRRCATLSIRAVVLPHRSGVRPRGPSFDLRPARGPARRLG